MLILLNLWLVNHIKKEAGNSLLLQLLVEGVKTHEVQHCRNNFSCPLHSCLN